jgi:hypothetical protein
MRTNSVEAPASPLRHCSLIATIRMRILSASTAHSAIIWTPTAYASVYAYLECEEPCITCTGYGQCLSCPANFYLVSGSCYPCMSTCATCISQGQCTGCLKGYYLSGTACLGEILNRLFYSKLHLLCST